MTSLGESNARGELCRHFVKLEPQTSCIWMDVERGEMIGPDAASHATPASFLSTNSSEIS
jgi:hypothetical protein